MAIFDAKFFENLVGRPSTPWTKGGIKLKEIISRAQPTSPKYQALDLGAGAGRDALELLKAKFEVTAVDSSLDALTLIPKNDENSKNIKLVHMSIEEFLAKNSNQYDLINASYILPFIAADRLPDVLQSIKTSLSTFGVFSANFFGTHDEWNDSTEHVTCLTSPQILKLLTGLKVVSIKEWNNQGQMANGRLKQWHIYGVVAVKGSL